MLPVMRRLPTVRQLIDRQSYFVLHAPRQVGKTTSLLALGRELSREGRYASVLVSMEVGAPFSHDVGAAELAIPQRVAPRRRGGSCARTAAAAVARRGAERPDRRRAPVQGQGVSAPVGPVSR
jgi:hypothetical protein